MIYQCLIVDDEPIAQQILEKYVSQIEALKLVGKCSNAFEALNILHQKNIDILFLDIKMPLLSGLEMLKTIHNPPKVILTTAFSEFAVQSYEFGVADYLLKPIPFDRFLQAVNKIMLPKNIDFKRGQPEEKSSIEPAFIFFKADKKIHKYYFSEILFIEGSGNYVKIHSQNSKPLLVLEKLNDLEKKLPNNHFMRVHKSFIVNNVHIQEVEGNILKVKGNTVPVSSTYKQLLSSHLNIKK